MPAKSEKGTVALWNGKRYYKSNKGFYYRLQFSDKARYLHRDVWEYYNGTIPARHIIHHKDKNKNNNHIDNLECLTYTQHSQRHEDIYKNQVFSEKCLRKAAEWHRSEEGRASHRRAARKYWPEWVERTCEVCGKKFMQKNQGPKAIARTCNHSCAGTLRNRNRKK